MRYGGGIYVADDPHVWMWAIDAIQEHVLAAEERALGRWVKQGVFRLLRRAAMRRCLPLRPVSDVSILEAEDPRTLDLVLRRSHGKWISFRVRDGVITRHFPSRWRWYKERWIRLLPAVAATSPKVLSWDEDRLTSQEQYIPGRPVRVHDLGEGITAWFDLWPLLGQVFLTRTALKPLRLPYWVRQSRARDWLHHTGLGAIVDEVGETPVLHGLIHGDLQQSNMLAAGDRFYVIDWGDHFHLGPPLYDLLFYMFKHAQSVGASQVARVALSDPDWIEQGLPGALQPEVVKASLVGFTLMLARRYQFRGIRRRRTLVRQLQSFIHEVALRLLPSARPYVQLPGMLLDLAPFGARSEAGDRSEQLGA